MKLNNTVNRSFRVSDVDGIVLILIDELIRESILRDAYLTLKKLIKRL